MKQIKKLPRKIAPSSQHCERLLKPKSDLVKHSASKVYEN